MNYREMEFLEEFKHLEKLCNQIYGEKHGVTLYIDEMKRVSSSEAALVPGWSDFLRNLKIARHKRNILVHNDIDDPEVEDYDIIWVKRFRQLLLDGQDPLAKLRNIRHEARIHGDAEDSAAEAGNSWWLPLLLIVVSSAALMWFVTH